MQRVQAAADAIAAYREGDVGFLALDRAERKNALSLAMWEAIPERLERLVADGVRVIVLRGARDLPFCAGADISEFEAVRASAEGARHYEAANVTAFDAIANCAVPTLAMIRGFCMGGGIGLATACDLRIAAAGAQFAIPPGRLGLAYPPQAIRYIVAAMGPAAAKDLLFTARRIGAEEAFAIGLLNRLVPPAALEAETEALAGAIAANAPLSLRAGKLAINHAAGYPRATLDAALSAADLCFDSEDYREGRTAFLAKRSAAFLGR
jgi:enoyl-CoA hydratase/carnithine racemase